MNKEEKFDKLLVKAGFLSDYNAFIPHMRQPNISLEVDNLGIKYKILFIFEGKSRNIKNAITQLKERRESFQFNKDVLIKRLGLKNYTSIRTFYYSFNKHEIKEIDKKGKILKTFKFDNSEDLLLFLRNL